MLLALGLVCAGPPLHADLKAALAEHDLGKRSKLALENAGAALKTAREAYQQGDNTAVTAAARGVPESVDVALGSLENTRKNTPKKPRRVKQAAIETSNLLQKPETP